MKSMPLTCHSEAASSSSRQSVPRVSSAQPCAPQRHVAVNAATASAASQLQAGQRGADGSCAVSLVWRPGTLPGAHRFQHILRPRQKRDHRLLPDTSNLGDFQHPAPGPGSRPLLPCCSSQFFAELLLGAPFTSQAAFVHHSSMLAELTCKAGFAAGCTCCSGSGLPISWVICCQLLALCLQRFALSSALHQKLIALGHVFTSCL